MTKAPETMAHVGAQAHSGGVEGVREAQGPCVDLHRCTFSSVSTKSPPMPAVPYQTYSLDSGDRVRVIVFGQDNLSRVYSVDGSGSIALPLIGLIRARGLTTFQLAGDIANELKRNMSRIRKSPSRSRPIGPSSSSESSTSPANIPMSRR
jgi:hypothetical protein